MTDLGFELSLFEGGWNHALIQKQAASEVMKYNDLTLKYGLVLTEQQAVALVETRSLLLKETGRIEFGGGIIDKIIFEFCDSLYLSMYNYEEVLHELIEISYADDADFAAQEIHITADYPVYNKAQRLLGIEFIRQYLD